MEESLNQSIQQMNAQAENYMLMNSVLAIIFVIVILWIVVWALNKHFENEKEKRNIERGRINKNERIEPKL